MNLRLLPTLAAAPPEVAATALHLVRTFQNRQPTEDKPNKVRRLLLGSDGSEAAATANLAVLELVATSRLLSSTLAPAQPELLVAALFVETENCHPAEHATD